MTRRIATVLLFLGLLSAGCARTEALHDPGNINEPSGTRYTYARVLMGTECRITLEAASEPEAAEAARMAFARIGEIERVLSDYDEGSEVSALARAPGGVWLDASATLVDALEKSRIVHEASGGAFDVALGRLSRLWRASRASGALPDALALADAVEHSGMRHVLVDRAGGRIMLAREGVRLDFGGIGKGIGVDAGAAALREQGVDRFLIQFGGDITVGDAPTGSADGWIIEYADGSGVRRRGAFAGVSISTSGDLAQFVEIDGERYSHILDPGTGLGLRGGAASTVIADEAWLADAAATAACVMGRAGASRLGASLGGIRSIEVWSDAWSDAWTDVVKPGAE